MNKSFTLRLLMAFLFFGNLAHAQFIWPGDVNNNGVTNCVDVLYWGVAYEKNGTARRFTNTDWQAQAMPTGWNWSFPNSVNYAYADANGDGKVDKLDVTGAVQPNFWKTHGTITPDIASRVDPRGTVALTLKPDKASANGGEVITISLELTGNALSNASPPGTGIAFVLNYDRSLVDPNSFTFEKINGNGITNDNSYALAKNNPAEGVVEIAHTMLAGENFPGNGTGVFGKFTFKLANRNGTNTLNFSVKTVAFVNRDLNAYPLLVNPAKILVTGTGDDEEPGPCPQVIEPVCGSDGKVYINSCYAEKAGVAYTPGVCNPDCVDPTRINPNAVCAQVYQPVCGCNGETYSNPCEAEAAGVKSYTTGPCKENDQCYDPNYVLTASYTEINPNNGTIIFTIPQNSDPVCGCNGVTYKNSYTAEANGITFYTKGSCSKTCVDPAKMDPDAVCTLEYDPVCGCNGVTYANDCIAKAAGVVAYTPGVCGGGPASGWCSKAKPLDCGNFLSGETTVDAGNHISNYPCSSKNYSGAEKVYIINKTSAGDLQIGLEIITPNLDLDMFLLAPNCNQITCLKSSTTNNTQTNNEGIVLEDAPTGTYYLVVDGAAAGQFRLELSCGYLYCGDAIPVTCGLPYNGNNSDGHDDVSLYGCSGSVYNVENNGPEKVHYFTLTQAGEVEITLTNLSANLELFLLKSCDRGSCLEFSQNGGTSNESITANLEAGTYYVVVDGYNGATSNYKLSIDCASASCNLNASITATNASCGQNNGSFKVHTTGGNPTYIISWEGPVSGTQTTQSNITTIGELPGGVYKVTIIDSYGCSVYKEITVGSFGNIGIQTAVTNATCGQSGKVRVTVSNGAAPLKVYLTGTATETYQVQSAIFTLDNLQPGAYHLYVVDANGCSASKDFTIGQGGGNFTFTATPTAAACENPGSILIKTSNGTKPFKVHVTGPKSGSVLVDGTTFTIQDLPGGAYTIKIEDANGCSYTVHVTVPTTELVATVATVDGTCLQPGVLKINVSSGKPNFIISWDGPGSNDGNITTSNTAYTIPNLPAGSYTVTIKDGNWCSFMKVVTISGGTSGFDFVLVPERGVCETPGSIGIDIIDGKAPYKITWDGPGTNDGNTTTSATWLSIPNLPAGTYKVSIKDDNGCTVTKTTTILASESNLSLKLTVNEGNCGQSSSISVDVDGGISIYKISWQGPVNGAIDTNNDKFDIKNLPAGTYTIKVVDGNWCSISKTIVVTGGSPGFDFKLTPVSVVCESPGLIKVVIEGGKAPYKITWDGPAGNDGSTSSNETNLEIVNLPQGSYNVTIKDGNGCEFKKTVTVSKIENSLSLKATVTEGNCGQPATILVDVDGGDPIYKISWDGPVDGEVDTQNDKLEIKNLPPGSYLIKIFDKNWCSVSKTVVVTGGSPGFDFKLTPVSVVCESPGLIKVVIEGGKAPYKITWDGPATNDGSTSSNETNLEIVNLPQGSYIVTIKDGNGCEFKKTVTVSKIENSLSLKTTLTEGNCGQPATILVDVDGGDPIYKISWDGPVDGEVDTQSDKLEIKNLPPGSYLIKIFDKNWCSVSKTVVVTGGSPGFDFKLTPVSVVCESPGLIKVVIEGGKAPYKITWDGPAGNDGSTSSNETNLEIVNLPQGSYTVTIKDGYGCEFKKTITVSKIENSLSLKTTVTEGNCGQPATILVDVDGGDPIYKISWDGPVDGEVDTQSDKFEIKNLPPGTYLIKIFDKNWCSVSKTVVVTGGSPGFEVKLTPTNGVCETPGKITVKIEGGSAPYKITWDGPAGNDGNATSNSALFEITNLPAGSYTVTVKDANNCVVTKTTQVSVPEGNLQLIATATHGTCGQNGAIKVTVSGGIPNYIIEWDGPVDGSQTTNAANYTISNLPAGSYTIKLTDGNWCTTSKVVVINSANGVHFTATPTHGTCESPGSIKLNLTGGAAPYTITWTGSGAPVVTTGSVYIINNVAAGNYTIKVTDNNGCVDTKTVTINANPGNLGVETTVNAGSCGANSTIWVTIIGGTPKYKIAWEGPKNGSIQVTTNGYEIPDLPDGKYTITITDANWCTVSTIVTVYHSSGDLFKAKPNPGVCETPGSIKLSFIGGMPVYQVSWTGPTPGAGSTSDSIFVIQNLAPGTYTIKVTDKKGCTETETVVLNQVEETIDFDAAWIVNACGQYNNVWIDINNGSPTYTVKWDGPDNQDGSGTTQTSGFEIQGLTPGKYTITVFDNNWCYADTMITIYHAPIDIFSATVTNGACNQGGAIKLKFTGMPDYEVKWDGPVDSTVTVSGDTYTIANLPAGSYILTVTDSKGCIEKDTVVVSGGGGLVADIDGTNGDCTNEGKIRVNIVAGTGPFAIIIDGVGFVDTVNINNLDEVVFADLAAGVYRITVKGAGGCSVTEAITITVTESVLEITATPTNAACGTAGKILLNITGGNAPYTITWGDQSVTTNNNTYTIPNLAAGNYTVTVKDGSSCAVSKNVKINAAESGLEVVATVTNGACGQTGQILVSATGGSGPFVYSWSGPTNGTQTVGTPTYTIQNLNSGTYNITVTDIGGCSKTRTASVTNNNQAPVANFSFTINGMGVTFANQSTPGTYQWNFGDQATATSGNPNHTYLATGTFNVCLKVTNSCGTKEVCKAVVIGTPSGMVNIDVEDGSGSIGDTIYIPVVVKNCITNTLVSVAGSLQIENTNVAAIVGIAPGAISPLYFANNKTFSYYAPNGVGVPCGEGQILFYVKVVLKGDAGASTILTIVNTPLAIEVGGLSNGNPTSIPHLITGGVVAVANIAVLQGEVITYWGDAIPTVEVSITSDSLSKKDTTDTNGRYNLSKLPLGKEYTVQPKLDGDPINGLSTYGLFVGQRFILGMEPAEVISPYQVIAGDANCDGRFSTLDLFIIQRLIIGTSEDFENCPSWVFVKSGTSMPVEFTATNVFPYHSCDTMMLMKDTTSNFIGVKVGDILGHANPALLTIDPRGLETLHLIAENRAVRAGEMVEIKLTSENFRQIASYQLGLSFDFNKLQFLEMTTDVQSPFANMALNAKQAADGVLRLSWFDPSGSGISTKATDKVFTLRFIALQDLDNLANLLEVNSRSMRSEAYTTTAEKMEIDLQFTNSPVVEPNEQVAPGYKLYQNVPNPFNNQTVIGFDLPTEMQAELTVFDQLGKKVRTFSGNYNRGYNHIELPRAALSAGAYYYTLRTGDFAQTKRMIIFE